MRSTNGTLTADAYKKSFKGSTRSKRTSLGPASLMRSELESAPCQKFTVDSVYEQIGGFGRFQLLALVLLTIIRNSGFACVYGYAMATEVPKYLCKEGEKDWEACSRATICSGGKATDFQYKLDRSDDEFFENWFT